MSQRNYGAYVTNRIGENMLLRKEGAGEKERGGDGINEWMNRLEEKYRS